jgi:hypothetical protein
MPRERVVDVDGTGVKRLDKRQVASDQAFDELLGFLSQSVRVDDLRSFR